MARKHTFTASDGKVIHYKSWIPRTETTAIIQIAHGMAEHSGRYEKFAKFCNSRGYSVYANDHRGHGETIAGEHEQGFFAEKDGWFRIAEDLIELQAVIKEKEPGKPIIMLGHSMGSFLVRTNMILHPDAYEAIILTGTTDDPGPVKHIGRILAKRAVRKYGQRYQYPKLDQISFGAYAKVFKPSRTKYDWLNRDTTVVDSYVEDPLCGFIGSCQYYVDILDGFDFIGNRKHLMKMNTNTPVLMMSGTKDVVGKMGKGFNKVEKLLKNAGIKDLTAILYDEARHEILNELNRDEVLDTLDSWIRSKAS